MGSHILKEDNEKPHTLDTGDRKFFASIDQNKFYHQSDNPNPGNAAGKILSARSFEGTFYFEQARLESLLNNSLVNEINGREDDLADLPV